MKHTTHILTILSTLLLLVLSCSRGEEMRAIMAEVEQRNQDYQSLADDTIMRDVVRYMDRHGTPNDRMKAHYLLGSVYRDRDEIPEALESFQNSLDCADTTAADCDYKLLCRVHSQMAYLYQIQEMLLESLYEDSLAAKYAWIAGDTLSAVISISKCSSLYYAMGEEEKALQSCEKNYRLLMEYGYVKEANTSLAPAIYIYLKRGDYQMGKNLLDLYEQQSRLTGQDSFNYKDFYLLYHYKGLYYLGVGQTDSASFYFTKQIEEGETGKNHYLGCYGLYLLYRQTNEIDSIVKYADLVHGMKDSLSMTSVAVKLKTIQSLYNYSYHQQLAIQKEKEAARSQQFIFLLAIVSIIIISVLVASVFVQKTKRKEERRQMEANYRKELEMQEQAQDELLKLKQNEYEILIGQKEMEIAHRKVVIEQMQNVLNAPFTLESTLSSKAEYKRFVYLTSHTSERVNDDDWSALKTMIEEQLPTFHDKLNSVYHLSEPDYKLCMLVRLNFSALEIATLMDKSLSYVSKRRRYLLLQIFDIKGKPEIFDHIIKELR